MNGRLIVFSAIMTAAIGAAIGIGLAEIKFDFVSPTSAPDAAKALHFHDAMLGAGVGFLVGAGLELVQELKKQQDREESLRDYLHTYLSLPDMDHKLDE